MSTANLQKECREWMKTLDGFYTKINLGLLTGRPRNTLHACRSASVLLCVVALFLFFSYLLIFQTTDFDVAVRQFWTLLYLIISIARGVNRIYFWDEMDELLKWAESVHQPGGYWEEYQGVIDEQLRVQNQRIKKILRYLHIILYSSLISYLIQPIILQTGRLQTPVTWNGRPDTDFPLVVRILLYATFTGNALNVVNFCLCNESFFATLSIIIGHRIATAANILKTLGYPGPRDTAKDKRIFKDCYLMHLDVSQKTKLLQGYFNLYGLTHFTCLILVDAILIYDMIEHGFDIVTFAVFFGGYSQLLIVCSCGEFINQKNAYLEAVVYEINWEDFDLSTKKDLLLFLMHFQKPLSISAGNIFILNFELFTQVTKLQMSIGTFLRTF